jgi:hypothetical protein
MLKILLRRPKYLPVDSPKLYKLPLGSDLELNKDFVATKTILVKIDLIEIR